MSMVTEVAVGATSTQIITKTDYRNGPLWIRNVGPERVYVQQGSAAGVADDYDLDIGDPISVTPAVDVYAICNGGNGLVEVVQGIPMPSYGSDVYEMRDPDPKTSITVLATSTVLLAENTVRTHALVQASMLNTEPIYLGFGAAAVLGDGPELWPGAVFEIGQNDLSACAINAICASGGMIAQCLEA